MPPRPLPPLSRPRLAPPLAALLALLAASERAGAQATGPVPVTASTAVRRSVQAGQTFVGTVNARRTSLVSSSVEQRVVEFPVNEGDAVREGQVLARLRTEPVELALAAAQADLAVLDQELAELKNGSRPEEIERGRAALARADAMRSYQRLRRNRLMSLLQSRNASLEEVDEAVAQAEQAEQAYLEAKAALDLLEKGPRAEQIAQAESRLLAQREEIRRLEDSLEEHTIRAPFDGYLVAENTQVGQWIAKGSPVVEMVELDQVDITVPVLEDHVRYLRAGEVASDREGTAARVELGALPGETFTGVVAYIIPRADVRSRTFPVKVRMENTMRDGHALIKAGMFARVTLPVGAREDALMVPKDAIVLGGRAPVVYVIDSVPGDSRVGKARPVTVQLGVADADLIQVRGELTEGQTVVIQGNERLRPGQEVTITEVVSAESNAGAAGPAAAR